MPQAPADCRKVPLGSCQAIQSPMSPPNPGSSNWPEFNAIYARWAGASRPSRAVVPVPALHYGFKIEIEAVATVPQGG